MKTKLTLISLLLLLAAISTGNAAAAPAAGGNRSDFALFDGTDPTANEIGAQCAARVGSSNNAVAFTYYVTVSNWSDSVKILRVLYADGEEMARFGRLHPRVASLYKFRQPVFIGELEFEKLLALPADRVRYHALARFPTVARDVSALIPDTVMWGDVEKAARDLGISEIVSVRVFDMYKSKEMPEGFHSLAFRVIYRGEGRTLTDEQVAGMHERVRALLEDRFGAQLR